MPRANRPPTIAAQIIALSLGGFFEYYDLFFAGYIAPGLSRSHLLGPGGLATFVAAMFSGLFVGTALCSFLSDRFGRRAIFTWSLLWYTAASVLMAFQHDPFGLNFWRFIAGIGVGVELVTIDAYLAELVPPEIRGRAFAFGQAIQFLAVPVVALLAWRLVPLSPLGLDGWRWVVLIGATGAILVWWIRRIVPESPRWLATRPVTARREKIHFLEIWRKPYASRTTMLIVFNIFQTVGFYGFSNWVPTLLIRRGISVTSTLEYTFLIAIAAPFGPLLGALIADRIERKWLIISAALAIAFAGLAFGQTSAAVLLVLLGVVLTLSNNVLSFAFHAYQAELYPTRVRATAIGFVYSFSRLSVVFSSFLIAFTLDRTGVSGVFALIAGSMAIVSLAIGIFGPRTRNLPLEVISE